MRVEDKKPLYRSVKEIQLERQEWPQPIHVDHESHTLQEAHKLIKDTL